MMTLLAEAKASRNKVFNSEILVQRVSKAHKENQLAYIERDSSPKPVVCIPLEGCLLEMTEEKADAQLVYNFFALSLVDLNGRDR